MSSLLSLVTAVIGDPPAGWEFVPYLVSVIIFLVVFVAIIRLFIFPLFRFFRRGF